MYFFFRNDRVEYYCSEAKSVTVRRSVTELLFVCAPAQKLKPRDSPWLATQVPVHGSFSPLAHVLFPPATALHLAGESAKPR